MKLLFPWGLLALLILAGVVFAYWLRLPRRRHPVPDLAPWLTVARADRRLSNQRRTLISLALQIVIVLLLVLAYVQPYFAAGHDSCHEIVLVDLSRSTHACDDTPFRTLESLEVPRTSGPSRLEKEKGVLLRVAGAMGFQDRMTLIGVGSRPLILASNEAEPAILHRRIKELAPRDEVADFRPACQLAVELATASPHVRVTVITDGSVHQLELEPLAELPATAGQVRYVPLGKSAENVGIVKFKSRKNLDSEGDFQAIVTLVSSCPQERKVPMALELNGKTLDVKEVELAAGCAQTVQFSKPYRVGGVLKARLLVQDALLEDNEALDYLPAPRRMKVALVTKATLDEKTLSEYYLSKILRCDTGIEGVFLPAADYLKIAQDKNALRSAMEAVVFDNWAPSAEQLPPVHALFINVEAPEIPGEVRKVLGDRPLIRKWDEGHPLTNYLNLRDVFLRSAKEFHLNDKSTDVVAELIIEFSVSNVSESPVGKRLHWFCETQ